MDVTDADTGQVFHIRVQASGRPMGQEEQQVAMLGPRHQAGGVEIAIPRKRLLVHAEVYLNAICEGSECSTCAIRAIDGVGACALKIVQRHLAPEHRRRGGVL